ncbi:hypothetical protein [Aquimarina litoralis]|uniref:hypothetical protein n=1 Tax=Aquimarina litoralis TaxID=584605 RepID=UPI001C589895|nr:hypothetical protein [Aquimarina litoralis]MBW1298275.1 hypothetical protein [Aquimarina litoralis]
MKTYLKDNVKKQHLNGISANKGEVIGYFNDLSPDVNSFISIINDNNYVLRFSWVAEQKWLVEFPIVTNQIHQQRYANETQCQELIHQVDANENFDNFEGFIQVPVEDFSLDEMLEFKVEDEALLKEEEFPIKKVISQTIDEVKIKKAKKISKPSIILGDIEIPKQEPRVKSIERITTKKKKKTSPLQQFKESEKKLKKETTRVDISRTSAKSIKKEVIQPIPPQNNTKYTSLLSLEKTSRTKKKTAPTLRMGAQIGENQKKTTGTTLKTNKKMEPTLEMGAKIGKNVKTKTPSAPSKSKETKPLSKKEKPSDDTSFFSI